MLKPMKAPHTIPTFKELEKHLPLYASPKYDGNRMIVRAEGCFSATGRLFRNKQLQAYFAPLCEFAKEQELVLDGELWATPDSGISFYELNGWSNCIDREVPKGITYQIFDVLFLSEWTGDIDCTCFHERFYRCAWVGSAFKNCQAAPQYLIKTIEELETRYIYLTSAYGLDGVILKSPSSGYKHGRATMNEATMFKLKPYKTTDAWFLTWEPMFTNLNEQQRTPTGDAIRPGSKLNREELQMLGVIIGTTEEGEVVRVASGLSHKDRETMYMKLLCKPDFYKGRWFELRYLECGAKDKPRHPTFIRWRDDIDRGPKGKTTTTESSGKSDVEPA
jgi:ATP-dependent DNA ligase